MLFTIASTSSCNLTCPSCPLGHSPDFKFEPGNMSAELITRIMEKATAQCEITYVDLFNVTEPLLNPKLDELVRAVNSFGVPCIVSSNLNIVRNIDKILAAEPAVFIVSVSGFEQSTYGITHRGGNIEQVKENMKLLSETWSKAGKKSLLQLTFHRYLGNQDEETQMRKYAEDLGFKFVPTWAHFLSHDKLMKFILSGFDFSSFNENDLSLINKLVIPYEELARLWHSERGRSCFLIYGQIALDNHGRVTHCTEDGTIEILGNFLDMTIEEIQRKKIRTPICRKCLPTGAHNIMNSLCGTDSHRDMVDKIDEMARKRLESFNQSSLNPISV